MKRIFQIAKWFLIVAIILVATFAIFLRFRYGGGNYYPNVATESLISADKLETVLQYDEPIGNATISTDGRIFFTVHPESRPENNKLLEWKDGKAVAYPNDEAQKTLFETPLGVCIDRQNRLWVIDHGTHGFGKTQILAFDLATNQLVHEYVFPAEIAQKGSFLQAFNIDSKGETVYIADVSFFRKNPAIVVYDVKSKTARRVLESDASVFPQDWIIRNQIKEMTFFGGLIALKAGVDGVAISRDDEWLYYAAMAHDTLFRVKTADLKNAELSAEELSKRVEMFSKKPLNDGLTIDADGNVFITDVENQGVMQIGQNKQLRTTIRSDKIRWADSLVFGNDGWIYLADSAIPEQMLQSKANIEAKKPYYIYRFKVPTQGVAGQ
jgi:sugar lactone lactonase YvrE